jgi:hypothetical protein
MFTTAAGGVTIVPNTITDLIGECQIIQVLKVQGVCQEWIVYAPVEREDNKFFVLNAITDGPLSAFQRFGHTAQSCPAFDGENYLQGFKDACEYAVGQAIHDLEVNFG